MRVFDELKDREVYIFGAGQQGRRVLEHLIGWDVNIKGFVDNSASVQGSTIQNTKVYSLDDLRGCRNPVFIISPLDNDGIKEQLGSAGFSSIIYGSNILNYTPRIIEENDFCWVKPFNDYESPYPDILQIRKNRDSIFDKDKDVLDIDLNVERQCELLEQMRSLNLVGWKDEETPGLRYYYKNSMFAKGSATVLCNLMQIVRPQRIIEVGSGFSTAVMLDSNNEFFDNSIEIISIEPRAERLKSLLRNTDRITIYEKDVQEIGFELFKGLDRNDFLFIDSSHVARAGSDVNYIIFEILPRLNRGVYIHFHDFFWPFIYPEKWVYEGWAYNEMYVLRAFLMNNNDYSIQFFGEMLEHKYPELTDGFASLRGSIWIRKE